MPAASTPTLICSSRGCRREAGWEIGWNNPKVHTPDRRKVWLACPDHRDTLADFLRLRTFLRDVTELPVSPAARPAK